MKKLTTYLIIALFFSGCSTLEKSIVAGATSGAAGGALIGNRQGAGPDRGKHTLNGALFGAAFGGLIGWLAYKSKMKKDRSKLVSRMKKSNKKNNQTPLLTMPKIKRVWVDDKIQGKKFVKGHWEFVIEENSIWSKQ